MAASALVASAFESFGTLLLLERSRTLRTGLARALRDRYKVLECDTIASAWQMLQQDPSIELLISALSLDDGSGLELISRVRGATEQNLTCLPIIVRSEDDKAKHLASEAGADEFIASGTPAYELQKRVATQLDLQRSRLGFGHDLSARDGAANEREFVVPPLMRRVFESRCQQPMHLVVVDISNFNAIGETFGDTIAHTLSNRLAAHLASRLRSSDRFFVLDRQHFAVLTLEADAAKAQQLSRRLQVMAAKVVLRHRDQHLAVSAASVSVAWLAQSRGNLQSLLTNAFEQLNRLYSQDK